MVVGLVDRNTLGAAVGLLLGTSVGFKLGEAEPISSRVRLPSLLLPVPYPDVTSFTNAALNALRNNELLLRKDRASSSTSEIVTVFVVDSKSHVEGLGGLGGGVVVNGQAWPVTPTLLVPLLFIG